MKRIYKLFAMISALTILLCSLFAFPVSAAGVHFSAGKVSGVKGETVTVNVSASGDGQLWGTVLKLGYDSSKLQYVSHSQGGLVAAGSINNSGSSVSFAGSLVTNQIKKGGVVFSVKFKILMDSGSTSLSLSSSENIDYNGAAVSCSTSGGSVSVTKPVTGITLNISKVDLKKGETAQLKATVTPADATNKTVKYTSSNSKVAKVDGNGKITAVGGGKATITAAAGGKKATCSVFVNVKQTGIKASSDAEQNVFLGSTLSLKLSKVPYDATDNYPVTWASENPEIATVSDNGTVTGVALGETIVTATSNGWTATYKIIVTENPEGTTVPESTTVEETVPETEAPTESTTAPAEEKGFFAGLTEKTVTRLYHYGMLAIVFVVTAVVSVAATYLITSGYYKNKDKKNTNKNDQNTIQ